MKTKLLIISLLLATTTNSFALDEPPLPNWRIVGKAKLEVFWFDIYNAELSTENGAYDASQPFKLTLTYLRDFAAKDLVEETFNQFPTPATEEQRQSWSSQLLALWPDVKKGERISFVKNEQGSSLFFFNEQYLGAIDDPKFSEQFAAIWLSKSSNYPKLAAQLTGAVK